MYISFAGQKVEGTTFKDAAARLEQIIAQGNLYFYPLIRSTKSKNLSRSHSVLTFEIVPFNKRLLSPRDAEETETICMGTGVTIFGNYPPYKISTHEDYAFEQLIDIAICLTLAGSNVYMPFPPTTFNTESFKYPIVLFDPDKTENAEFVACIVS